MKKILLLILVGTLIGCKNFQTKKLSPDQIVEEEMEHMDFEALDSYPSFEICDKKIDKAAKRQCFEKEVSKRIYKTLGKHVVILKDSIYEKIELTITISAQGKAKLAELSISDRLEHQIPDIKKWLNQGVTDLSDIYPAEKRGVPVSSRFKIPLIIASN